MQRQSGVFFEMSDQIQENFMKNGFKKSAKRLLCGMLAIVMAAMTFVYSPVTADAAGPVAKGIDVSKYQGAINWSAVKNAGYQFAFIKIGSAKSGLDPYFGVNMTNANAAGVKTGAYIYSYATSVEGAIAEANFAIAALEPYTVSMPVVYDLEDAVHKNMSKEALGALTVAFCETIKAAGYYPVLYANKSWATKKIADVPYDKWIAQYSDVCEYPDPAFWQFSSSGSVPGISGKVDLNFQFKDYSSLIVANGFVNRNGQTYYYKNYRMQHGFVADQGKLYFMNADGTLYKNGWLGDGVNMYYMDTSDGHMLSGLVKIGQNKYYFGADGLMQRGLVLLDGQIYMFGTDGAMVYGWYQDEAGLRYFAEDGHMLMATTLEYNGVVYQFDGDGIAAPVAADPAAAQ